jgi:hypothetical protein
MFYIMKTFYFSGFEKWKTRLNNSWRGNRSERGIFQSSRTMLLETFFFWNFDSNRCVENRRNFHFEDIRRIVWHYGNDLSLNRFRWCNCWRPFISRSESPNPCYQGPQAVRDIFYVKISKGLIKCKSLFNFYTTIIFSSLEFIVI